MRRVILLLCLMLLVCLGAGLALGGQGGYGRQRYRLQGGGGLGQHRVPAVNNPLYREQCGACHMAYQPALLPAASWQAILAKLPEHFGEQVEQSASDRAALEAYLRANAAETCPSPISRQIFSSLGGRVVLRISQVPYILHQHQGHDIPAGAFERKSVGSRGNCRACHPTAELGCYNDDLVSIPR